MGLAVRRAEPTDARELARLRWQFRPELQSGQSFERFASDFEGWLLRALASDWTAAVAAEADGALVGCLFLESVDKVPNPGTGERRWGYVTNSFVEPAYRGQGVGRKLLDLIIAAAEELGHEFLIVWPSEEAVSFYSRAGFREVADVHSGFDDYPPMELVL